MLASFPSYFKKILVCSSTTACEFLFHLTKNLTAQLHHRIYAVKPLMSEIDLGSDICVELIDGETYLLHGVSVTYRDLTVGFGVEVIGYAERSSDLVLAAISLAD